MHYVEYIYLIAGLMIAVFMWVERSILSGNTQIKLGAAILLLMGMYVLRRSQRMKREKILHAEIDRLREEEEISE